MVEGQKQTILKETIVYFKEFLNEQKIFNIYVLINYIYDLKFTNLYSLMNNYSCVAYKIDLSNNFRKRLRFIFKFINIKSKHCIQTSAVKKFSTCYTYVKIKTIHKII